MDKNKPWTVADLIGVLSQLPPETEIWFQNVDAFYPIKGDLFPQDETAGLSIRGDKLVLFYDWIGDGNKSPLDRSKLNEH